MLLTTSLTPRFRHLASEAAKHTDNIHIMTEHRKIYLGQKRGQGKSHEPRRTSLRVFLESFLPASGLAMGASATGVFFFSVSVSLPIAAAVAAAAALVSSRV